MDEKIYSLATRLNDKMDNEFKRLDEKIDSLNTRLNDKMDSEFKRLDTRINSLEEKLELSLEIRERLTALEAKVAALSSR